MVYRFQQLIGNRIAEITDSRGRTHRVPIDSPSNYQRGQVIKPTLNTCHQPVSLPGLISSNNRVKVFKDMPQPRRVGAVQETNVVPVIILTEGFLEGVRDWTQYLRFEYDIPYYLSLGHSIPVTPWWYLDYIAPGEKPQLLPYPANAELFGARTTDTWFTGWEPRGLDFYGSSHFWFEYELFRWQQRDYIHPGNILEDAFTPAPNPVSTTHLTTWYEEANPNWGAAWGPDGLLWKDLDLLGLLASLRQVNANPNLKKLNFQFNNIDWTVINKLSLLVDHIRQNVLE